VSRGPADPRAAALGAAAGVGAATLGLVLAAVTGGPYLTSGDVNGWLVLFALGLLGALVASPFLIESLISSSRDDVEARWDLALPLWGAAALAVGGIGLLVGLASGFSGDSLGGSAGLIAVIESGLVVLTLAALILAG
jgi:hypothetical protein